MSEIISTPRIIGHYQGQEAGPLVIAFGGLHGNEPAGVLALEQLFDLLAEEPQINPAFSFRGEFLALRGNLNALARGVRYVDQDLNRAWNAERIAQLRKIRATPFQEKDFSNEDNELLHLLDAIEIAVEESQASRVVILDLHTTTAEGGIFTITGDDLESLEIGTELYAPVIIGMMKGIENTALCYFNKGRFGPDIQTSTLCFEAGQHDEPESVERALAATINLLRAVGCVQPADVSTIHDEMLQQYSQGLPIMTELVYVHRLEEDANFRMLPGFTNFQPIEMGQQLATDKNGPILAPAAGYLLMPLYQKLGNEGFFIVQDYDYDAAY